MLRTNDSKWVVWSLGVLKLDPYHLNMLQDRNLQIAKIVSSDTILLAVYLCVYITEHSQDSSFPNQMFSFFIC